jgi:hypothetical protein
MEDAADALMARRSLQPCGVVRQQLDLLHKEPPTTGRTLNRLQLHLRRIIDAVHHNTLADPEMQLPLGPRQHLCLACQSGDVAGVSELFADQSLSTDDATFALEKVLYPKHEVIQVLLQNGADAGVIGVRSIPWSRRPTELLRLLAENGYDFKPDGHLILQSVLSPRPQTEN